MNLVCCAFQGVELATGVTWETKWWLDGDEHERQALKQALLEMREDTVFVAFNVVAEASSFIALKLDPAKFKWVDLQVEWKMLLNHNHKFMYGDQLIKGQPRRTRVPKKKWEMTERELLESDSSKAERSLVACVYKMLGKNLDFAHKDEMRDLILSEPKEWREDQRRVVLDYCLSDAKVLPPLEAAILQAYADHPLRHKGLDAESHRLWRGESAARAALIEKTGYPVNREQVQNFARSVPSILNDICKDINTQFPDAGYFFWDKKRATYTMKQKPFRDFIAETPHKDKWLKTDGGAPSLALDAWTRHYDFKHDYPTGHLPAQVIRFLKTKQSVNGFLPAPKTGSRRSRRTFFDSYGADGRARCWLNPYGSQSSRFQPQATGFIPLKSAWMRSMIQPEPGFSICSIDYASEEFLLAALLSEDKNMYESYASGDPYLAFAKLAGAVPEGGTKETHPLERLRFKSTTLGIGYLMGEISLAAKLTLDTGIHHTPEQAKKLIDLYFQVYPDYARWIDKTIQDYRKNGYLSLLDGWVMFGDNDNYRSISNCPVQGAGACVLRKSIQIAQLLGLRVIIPLHDALYIEYPTNQPGKIDDLVTAMLGGFLYYFKESETLTRWASAIRLDIDAWGPDLPEGEIKTPAGRIVKSQKIYIDPRAKNEYSRFSRYFTANNA